MTPAPPEPPRGASAAASTDPRHTTGAVMTTADTLRPILASGTFRFADLEVHRLGYGTMQLTGDGVWGEPKDRDECIRVLRRAVELGVDFIDTAAAYGPYVSEELIREALHPYADD